MPSASGTTLVVGTLTLSAAVGRDSRRLVLNSISSLLLFFFFWPFLLLFLATLLFIVSAVSCSRLEESQSPFALCLNEKRLPDCDRSCQTGQGDYDLYVTSTQSHERMPHSLFISPIYFILWLPRLIYIIMLCLSCLKIQRVNPDFGVATGLQWRDRRRG